MIDPPLRRRGYSTSPLPTPFKGEVGKVGYPTFNTNPTPTPVGGGGVGWGVECSAFQGGETSALLALSPLKIPAECGEIEP